MNKTKTSKQILSILLAVVMLVCAVPVMDVGMKANAASYSPSAALEYAAANWNSGVELCAGFVSNCLIAGGVNVFERVVKPLYNGFLWS